MDNNNFKKSKDFSNVESNIENNPASNVQNRAQNDTTHHSGERIKDERNPEVTQENFIKDAENTVPPKAWDNQEKAYNDAYENNKNQQLDDDM